MDEREKQRIILNLRSTPNELDDLLNGVMEETFVWRPIPNRWSVKELLCHFRDVERYVFHSRYRLLLTESEPAFQRFDPDAAAAAGDYIHQDASAVFAAFKSSRLNTIDLLNGLSPGDWNRAGIHPSGGRLSLHDFAIRHCEHDLNHLGQMKDIIRLKLPY